jgi:hypothetical protein
MPFEKVETQVDFPAQERAVLEFQPVAPADDLAVVVLRIAEPDR